MLYLRDVSSTVRDGIDPRDLLPPPGVSPLTPSATAADPNAGNGGGVSGVAAVTLVELDVGLTPVKDATILINDASVTPSSKVEATLSGSPGTGKAADEPGMDDILLLATPQQGHISFYLRGLEGYISGKFKANYLVGSQ